MAASPRFTFGPYELEPRSAQLRRGKRFVPLTAKAFRLLQCLVERPAQLLTKEELLATVWPGVVVSDAALTARIHELRVALREDATQPRYIETVHRRGFRFIAPVNATRPLPGSPSPAPHFVGRGPELATLQSWSGKALDGERQVIFITGEAGIGKTALVDAFLHRQAAERQMWIGRGQCVEQYGEGEAYLPVLEALRQVAQEPAGNRVASTLRQHAPTWLVQIGELAAKSELEAQHRTVMAPTPERMLREITEAIEALSAERPLVLVCEDLQSSDRATLDLITYLAHRREWARLLVIGTYRPADLMTRDHPLRRISQDLCAHGTCQELALGLLSVDHVEEYLRGRLHTEALRAGLASHIHQRTEGNPLFMVNLVEHLVQRGVLIEAEGLWSCTASADDAGVPDSLRQMIESRLEALPPRERHVLEVASVAGTEFAVASVAAGHEDPLDAIEDACDEIARKGDFLQACGIAEWPDGTLSGQYRFRHALYQNTLYARMAEARRLRLHRAIGERKEAGYRVQAAEIAAELAAHFEEARDYRRAAQYRQQAADTALRRSAYRQAVDHLTAAAALVQKLPDSSEQLELELMLQISLGPATMTLKGYADPAVERSYRRARELCEQTGHGPQLFRVLPGLRGIRFIRAEVRAAREVAEQHLALAEAVGEPGLLTWAHYGMGETALFAGDCAAGRMHLQKGIDSYDPQRESVFYTVPIVQSPGVACLTNMAWALWLLGYPDQAVARREQGITLAEELSHPFSLAFALVEALVLHEWLEETQAVRRRAERLRGVCQDYGFPMWMATAVLFGAVALVDRRPMIDSITKLREGLGSWRATGAGIFVPYFLSLLARAYARNGQIGAGLETIAEALDRVEQTGERIWEAELYRLKGRLILDQGQASPAPGVPAKAEECFQQALAIAREQGARSLELRAAVNLARLWHQHGKTAAARQALAEICDWFTEGFDTADVKEARALLGELSSR
jgi:DNA-binding winged helix-turn-helix (wHTH) protein/predicted ATPase